jgi:hypothetical protein
LTNIRFCHVIQCLSKSSQRFHGLLKITRPRGTITLTKGPEVSQRAPRYLKGHRDISKGAKVSQRAPRYLKAPQGISKDPKVSQRARRYLKGPQGISKGPEVSQRAPSAFLSLRSLQESSEDIRCLREFPKVFRRLSCSRNPLRSSKVFATLPKSCTDVPRVPNATQFFQDSPMLSNVCPSLPKGSTVF